MDRAQAVEARDEARRAINEAGVTGDREVTVRIASDSDGTRVLDEPKTYCPGRLPCLGRTGVRIAVPVRVVTSPPGEPMIFGEQVGELHATYCPDCQAMKADERDGATVENLLTAQ